MPAIITRSALRLIEPAWVLLFLLLKHMNGSRCPEAWLFAVLFCGCILCRGIGRVWISERKDSVKPDSFSMLTLWALRVCGGKKIQVKLKSEENPKNRKPKSPILYYIQQLHTFQPLG
jgi:hypothetical protein